MSSIPSKTAPFMATLLLGAYLSLTGAFAADKPQTFTGKVSDAMCGAGHMMAGDAAACVRACVNKGQSMPWSWETRCTRSTPATRPRWINWTSSLTSRPR